TVLLEEVPYLGPGSILVVREDAEEHCDTSRPVALVRDLLVLLAGQFPRTLLDRALDVVGGHVGSTRGLGRGLEPQVRLGVPSAVSRRHRYLPKDLGEELPSLHVRLAFLPLDLRPP